MARTGRNKPVDPTPARRRPEVHDERLANRLQVAGDHSRPIRTVIYIEVGSLPPREVQQAVAQINQKYSVSNHPTFVVPLRDGRADTDVFFELEIIKLIRDICEVRDGQIELKGPTQSVDVLRIKV